MNTVTARAVLSRASFAFVIVASTSLRAVAVSFTPLGFLPGGGSSSRAADISADGMVIVGASGTSYQEAFRWTQNGGLRGLGRPDNPTGCCLFLDTFANAISPNGVTVVGHGAFSLSATHAMRWTTTGSTTTHAFLPDINNSAVARGVSNDGTKVVGYGNSENRYGMQAREAFLWTPQGGRVKLGFLEPSGRFDESFSNDVSADGSTIVGRSGNEAFRWTAVGGMVGLGDLPGGSFSSEAYAVSADGLKIVGRSASGSNFEAFRWTADEGMAGLGDLPGGNFYSEARGVSADGLTVVGIGSGNAGLEAFVWDSVNGMRSLSAVLRSRGEDLFGWHLEYATAVSADGRYVVGYGTNPSGQTEAWRADLGPNVPEPTTSLLVFAAALAMVRLRRRESTACGMKLQPARNHQQEFSVSPERKDFVRLGPAAITYLAPLIATTILPTSAIAAMSFTPLGDLPGGDFNSNARGVSADGSTVVGESISSSGFEASGFEAFRWTAGGGMVGLGDLPGDGFSSSARGVSADGSTVVGDSDSSTGRQAFIWDSDHGMRRLADVLKLGGLDLADWRLESLTAISPNGRYITGRGLNPNGNLEAWLIDLGVPEPCGLVVAWSGLAGLAAVARRSRNGAHHPGRYSQIAYA